MEVSYAESNFGKPLTSIALDDLNRFFSTEQEESDTLEFKSYYEKGQEVHKHKENGVLKTICAFLNSSGGLLIWGAPIGHTPEGRRTKIFTGDLSPVTMLLEKDTFISRVANSVYPLSNLVRMHRVEVESGCYVYIIDVGQSTHKPHQFDNRYWVRSDGQTNVAPHYLIDALFKQVRYPNLGGYIKFEQASLHISDVVDLHMKVCFLNHSSDMNEYDLYFSINSAQGEFIDSSGSGITDYNGHQYRRDGVVKILSYSSAPYHDIILRVNHPQFENEPTEIMLMFGGKLCPIRRSEYKLTFTGFSGFSRSKPEAIKRMFSIESTVNMPMIDSETSEDERVRRLLEM